MSARKRSGALTALPLVALLAACAPGAPEVPPGVLAWDPVAVLTSDDDRQAGVNGFPLAPGESLLFAYSEPVAQEFWMRGVSYPLQLRALDEDGTVLGAVDMAPCPGSSCPNYTVPGEAAYWLETRP